MWVVGGRAAGRRQAGTSRARDGGHAKADEVQRRLRILLHHAPTSCACSGVATLPVPMAHTGS